MERERAYLDHNATSAVKPEVAQAVARALVELPGNPSSIHREGRTARAAIEAARARVAGLVGAAASRVAFTSGGTEASNAVLSGALRRRGLPAPTRLLIGATEHPCGLQGHGFTPDATEILPVDADGVLRLDVLEARLATLAGEGVTALVSVQAANNETGVVQPLARVAALTCQHGALLHTDAVQAAGRISIGRNIFVADAVTLSGHKLGGPKGVGAIVLGEGAGLEPAFIRGGGQEARLRAGTENLPGIVGFGLAAELALAALPEEAVRLAALRDGIAAGVRARAPEAVVFGEGAERLPNTLCFAVPGLKAETALIALDLDGVAVSSGAACASGKVSRSGVLAAMGVESALSAGALRVSLGWNSRQGDGERFLAAFDRLVSSLYKRRERAA
ncbi:MULTISPECIES: cysteine desulfurase family protein [Methylobacterium]|jgi:cysteine desulfurase|uniref:cysteine desulfurase family protein n=3 Tax=Methylobacteriaceae TaxID=119045 RepID=UPI0008EBCF48|nr:MULTISPECIES: cysteine desulfurase family protein [Methylobacterium]MBK3400519.1 cysteine desulfurase [Methylobacterium ajmalii]MBK3409670.1 cysteine desulfurase [Methylobacterium ajmalii]MBZ6416536.1 cysteine desulfurase [Methylobacterium sp.]SFF41913.1 cysteine desulfurase [Methylobacterium sp. yr596]